MKIALLVSFFFCTFHLNAQNFPKESRDNFIPATVRFYGSQSAKLFSREIEASVKGAIENNLFYAETAEFPKGFARSSLPGHPWYNTSWTRDAGTFLRELALWGYIDEAALVAEYLRTHVALNPDGYYTFPNYFKGKSDGWGVEMDGTSVVVIGMVRLWQRLPSDHDLKKKLQDFLTMDNSPVAYIVKKLHEQPLIDGSGEFGGGWMIKGRWYNIVSNILSHQALLVSAEMEEECGSMMKSQALRTSAAKLMENINKYLIDHIGGTWIWSISPVTMQPDSAVLNNMHVKGVASINGAMGSYADASGLEPVANGWTGIGPAFGTLKKIYTYPIRKKQFEKYGMCTFLDSTSQSTPVLNYASWLSYCDCYAAQTMLLLDKTETLDKVMTWIAGATYMGGIPTVDFIQKLTLGKAKIVFNAPDSTFWFTERNFSPDYAGLIDRGCGKLNIVNVAEPLKLARIMLGIDDRFSDTVKIVPRLPGSWTGVEAFNWPVKTKTGVIHIDLTFEKRAGKQAVIQLKVRGNKTIPNLAVRFPGGTRKECSSVSGTLKLISSEVPD